MKGVFLAKKRNLAFLIFLILSVQWTATQAQPLALYGAISNELVTISTTNAQVTPVGPFNNALTPLGNLTYHAGTGQLLGVANLTTTPNLVSLNTSTGAATVIAPITLAPNGTPAGLMEGLSYNPLDGLLYGSLDTLSPPTSFTSSILVTINPATGVATRITNISGTCQGEADAMSWANGTLYTIDGCPNPNRFYSLNAATGVSSQIGITGVAGIGDLAYEPIPDLVYGYDNGRQLWTINTTTAVRSVIGTTHTSADFSGQFFRGIAFAPAVILPLGVVNLEAWPASDANHLQWETAEDGVYLAHVVERSRDGEVFEAVARIDGTEGQGKEELAYADRSPVVLSLGTVYYRVQSLLADGEAEMSAVVEVRRSHAPVDLYVLWPNPVGRGEAIRLQFVATDRQAAKLEISDLRGRKVWTASRHLEEGMNELALALPMLPGGIYLLKIRTRNHSVVRKFMID